MNVMINGRGKLPPPPPEGRPWIDEPKWLSQIVTLEPGEQDIPVDKIKIVVPDVYQYIHVLSKRQVRRLERKRRKRARKARHAGRRRILGALFFWALFLLIVGTLYKADPTKMPWSYKPPISTSVPASAPTTAPPTPPTTVHP